MRASRMEGEGNHPLGQEECAVGEFELAANRVHSLFASKGLGMLFKLCSGNDKMARLRTSSDFQMKCTALRFYVKSSDTYIGVVIDFCR